MPTQTPYLPITPDEIAEEAFQAYQAGATIAHVHIRDPKTGMPSTDVEIWKETLAKIKEKCDIIVQPTTGGGGPGFTIEKRMAVVGNFEPEMCSFNVESMNMTFPFSLTSKPWQEWEKMYIKGSFDNVFKNSFQDIQAGAALIKKSNTKPSCEIFGTNGLYNLYYAVKQGWVESPPHIEMALGALGGTWCRAQELLHLQTEALRLFGEGNFTWSVVGIGYPGQFQMAALALMQGGNVRVGIEDNIRIRADQLAKSNAELVKEVVKLGEILDRIPTTVAETREILGLKGSKLTKI